MAVEIWDEKTRNAIDEFPTVELALAFIRETIALGSERDVLDWAMDAPDAGKMVHGLELINLAKGVAA